MKKIFSINKINNQTINSSKLLYYCIIIMLLFTVSFANAATITSAATGNWNTAGTWTAANNNRTGSVTSLTTSTAVTGSGTLFLSELSVGSIIGSQSGKAIGTVASITDNTHLTLTANATNTVTGLTYRTTGGVPSPVDNVTINGGNTITINGTFTCATLQLGNNSFTTATLTFATSGSPSLSVSGALVIGGVGLLINSVGIITFTSGSRMTAGSLQFDGSSIGGSTGTINMTAGGTISIGGAITIGTDGGGTWTPGTGTVIMTANNTLPATIFTTFNNLSINSGTTTLGTNTTVSGVLTIGTGSTFDVSTNNFALNVSKDFTNNGTFTQRSGTVTLNGSVAQNINGTTATTFNNLTINNSNGITLGANETVSSTLTLTSGNVTTGSNTLILGTSTSTLGILNRTSGTIITGSSGGFARWFAAATVSNVSFPVGTSGNFNNVTLSFTVAPTTGGTLTAKFVASDPGTNSATPITDGSYTVDTYSPSGYWQIDNSGITNGTYSIGFEGQGFNVGGTSILNYPLLRVLKRPAAGNNWSIPGTYVAGTGTNNDPTAWRSGLSGFSQFAYGGNNPDNPFAGPLPVELASFTSSTNGRNVTLNWSTMSEQNNSGFQIERINNYDNQWSILSFVKGKNNNNSNNLYSYSDNNLQSGKYSYRLKQIDYNGNYKYYNLNGNVEIGLPSKITLSQNYPNPFNPTTKIDYALPSDSKTTLVVYDMLGREVSKLVDEQEKAGFYTVQFNTNNFASGMYFYRLITNANGQQQIITKKLTVIK